MSIYLKPPKGLANLHVLQECVQQRINCFDNLQNGIDITEIENFDYLIEDSILDRTGHFIFRLAVLAGLLPKNIFLMNELKLLNTRIKCYDKDDMKNLLKNIINQLKDCIRSNIEKELSDFYWTLYNVVNKMLEKDFLSHVFKKHSSGVSEERDCDRGLCILVPFWYCNKLIAKREVDLKNGNVIFECHQWKHILPTLYSSYLRIILTEMKYSRNAANALADDRIAGCLNIISKHYSIPDTKCNTQLRLKELELESTYFPLCMKNLYDILKKKHRLAHEDRFNFSLFLKGVGLSLNDSIKFWQGEYTKQRSSFSKCSHSWHDNEKKYVYGIRHLYGLEGSRKNYSVRTCNILQESSIGINCEGGCPYVHHDDETLRSILKNTLPGLDDEIEVIIFERKENPSLSCKLYGECTYKLNQSKPTEDMNFENPLQFFNQMKKGVCS